ncbi:VOC family protein [Brevundimonas sp.]|jgi:extradiol dioxygenase family protein|uniref:VOC family protein n=1 Tax=Brevundimonas sp. TaxID=1871086 RepID=UPI002E102D41|nr:VOC family protein [Brevundimonas sp.]
MFHLSLPVADLNACELFYQDTFGATVQPLRDGVSNVRVFEAQLTFHERKDSAMTIEARTEMHFGHVVSIADWKVIHARVIEVGIPLVHCTVPARGHRGKLMVKDPSGNLIEINSSD